MLQTIAPRINGGISKYSGGNDQLHSNEEQVWMNSNVTIPSQTADNTSDPYTFKELEERNVVSSLQMYSPRSITGSASVHRNSVPDEMTMKACDMLPRHPVEAAKVKSNLLKTCPPAYNATNGTLVPTKTNGKLSSRLQNSKLGLAKLEKSIDFKSKVTSNVMNKTAAVFKTNLKIKRPIPSRSLSLDSKLKSVQKNKCTQIVGIKSLLHESLLGKNTVHKLL